MVYTSWGWRIKEHNEDFHVRNGVTSLLVPDEVDYARCDKTRKRIKQRGKIEEPWPGRGGGGGEWGICSKTSKQPAFPFMSYYAEARTHIGKCLTALCRRCLTRSRENIKTRPIPHRIDFSPDLFNQTSFLFCIFVANIDRWIHLNKISSLRIDKFRFASRSIHCLK